MNVGETGIQGETIFQIFFMNISGYFFLDFDEDRLLEIFTTSLQCETFLKINIFPQNI